MLFKPSMLQDAHLPEWVVVILAGGFGGFINSYLITGGLLLAPQTVTTIPKGESDTSPVLNRRRTAFDPTFFGLIVVGGAAGFVFWAYTSSDPTFGLGAVEAKSVAGALVAGIGGGRLLRSYVDKTILEGEKSTLDRGYKNMAQVTEDLVNVAIEEEEAIAAEDSDETS